MTREQPDTRFHVQTVRMASRWKATRYAVFSSILTPAWKAEDRGVGWALDKLYYFWRERLDSLRNEGWAPAQDDTDFTYLRNCPPFGVTTVLAGRRRCKRSTVCPFCYARDYVLKAYVRLEEFAFGGMDPTTPGTGWKKPPPGLHLVEYSHRSSVKADNCPKYTPEVIQARCCATIRNYLRARRRREFDLLRGERGVTLVRAVPAEGCIRLWVSGIVLTAVAAPPGLRPEGVSPANYRFTDHEEWGKTDMARACGRVFSYPREMLTAPAIDVIALGNGLRRLRMLTGYERS